MRCADVKALVKKIQCPGRTAGLSTDPFQKSVLTMRFHTSAVEAGYVLQQTIMLPGALFQVSLIVFCVCIVNLGLFDLDRDSYSSQAAFDIRVIQGQIVGCCAFVALCVMVLTRCRPNLLAHRRVAFVREILVIGLISLTLLAPIACTPYYMTKVMGLDILEVWGDDRQMYTEAPMLLCMQALITGSHMKLPVRWCCLAVLEVLGILYYAVCTTVIGSPEGFVGLTNMVFHASLIIIAALGKRQAEWRDRENYVKIATEITRRAEVEFKLAGIVAHRRTEQTPAAGSASRSESGSVPTTTDTGFQFKSIEQHGTGLDPLVHIGIREGWLVAEHELHVLQGPPLGSGGFGVVVAGIFNGTPVAVKVSELTKPRDKKQSLDWFASLANEIRVLRKLQHPNVVLFHGACFGPGGVLLVLGLIKGETLHEFASRCARQIASKELKDNEQEAVQGVAQATTKEAPPSMTDLRRCQVLAGISRALVYLHTRCPSIVHGDLKPSNVMVEHHVTGPVPKLLDFGLSRAVTRSSKFVGGTLRWMAPEVIASLTPGRPDPMMDIYSFGCIAFFIASNQSPFPELSAGAIKKKVKRNELFNFHMTQCLGPFTEQCRSLVEMCVRRDPTTRPTILEVHALIAAMPMSQSSTDCICAIPEKAPGQLWKDAAVIYKAWVRNKKRHVAFKKREPSSGLGSISENPEDLPAPDLRDGATVTRDPTDKPEAPLLLPGTAESKHWAMTMSLLSQIVRWNCRVEKATCCRYHSLLQALQDLVLELKEAKCLHFVHGTSKQCPKCCLFAIDDADDTGEVCDICGHFDGVQSQCPNLSAEEEGQTDDVVESL